ncbi:uncharacterized protein LOC120344410 [Styela clava]
MPDTDRLSKLIQRRKIQEKQNDRIRVHKNKLENMRLEKLSNFFDWSKNLLKHEHLSTEAKCIKKLEKLYERQCQIDEKKKIEAAKKRRKEANEEKYKKALGIDPNGSPGFGRVDDETLERRRRVTSASQQEQAKSFMSKVKSLSSGYRDNDPPQVYYQRKGIVPPDRIVTPEVSYSAQAQQGGGFFVPPSAVHVKQLKKWHGIPEDAFHTQSVEVELTVKKSLPPEKPQFNLLEALKATEDGLEGLEILEEEDESESGETTPLSSMSSDGAPEIDEVQLVNIRPSTAPVPRTFPSRMRPNKNLTLPESGLLTGAGDEAPVSPSDEPKTPGILVNRLMKRPSTAEVSFSGPDLNETTSSKPNPRARRPLERRQSSVISFSDSPQTRRRSSIATPLALLHRRQSNVAAIHRNIRMESKLLKPKQNKMKRKSGKRMGLMQAIMTNEENEVLVRKLREKSHTLAMERQRRIQEHRAQSAPSGGIGRRIQTEENYPTTRRLSSFKLDEMDGNANRKDSRGQKILLNANMDYSVKLTNRVKSF